MNDDATDKHWFRLELHVDAVEFALLKREKQMVKYA